MSYMFLDQRQGLPAGPAPGVAHEQLTTTTAGVVVMYDAITPQQMPVGHPAPTSVALAAYCDGIYIGDWIGCVNAWPELSQKQYVCSIASRVATNARIIDYEPGNPCYGDPDGVAQWVLRMLAAGVYKPGAYASRSDMGALQAAWVNHNVPRDQTTLWVAAPGSNPQPYLDQGFDAVQSQWWSNYDVSVCKASFFPGAGPAPAPHPQPIPINLEELEPEMITCCIQNGFKHVFVFVPHNGGDLSKGGTIMEVYETGDGVYAGGATGHQKALAYPLAAIPENVAA